MRKYFLFLIFCPSLLFAQSDSLKNLLSYYPLNNGDYWEYKTFSQQIPYPGDSSAYSVEVIGDSTFNNNMTYKILLFTDIYPDKNIHYIFERIDSSTSCVYRYARDTSFPNKELKIDSLFSQTGDTLNTSRTNFSSFGFVRTICRSIRNDTLLGTTTQVKTYFDQSYIPGEEYQLAKGFGFYSSSSCEFSCGSTWLVYANINGIEYGDKIITGIDDEKTRPINFSLFQNYPNPFNPSTNIIFEIPRPGEVTIKIFDMLGKEIKNITKDYSNSGIHRIVFEGSKYSSGIYIYQIGFSNRSISKKMLLIK